MDTISCAPLCKPGAEAAVVASDRVSGYPEEIRGRLFGVGDTLAALQELARAVRRAWGRRIAAVTGSVGKTTTKEILAALLGAKFRVLKSEGNLNNEYGLPLTLLRLEPEDQGRRGRIGHVPRGELRRLAEIAEPEVGVVTRVAPVHLEFFASIDDIALAKRELIEGLAGPDPVAVLNADDPRVARFADVARGRVLTFGCGASGTVSRARRIQDHGAEGSDFEFVGPRRAGATQPRASRPAQHRERARGTGGGQRLGHRHGGGRGRFPPDQSRERCAAGCFEFAAGFALINDSYNSNPVALGAMVDLLANTGGAKTGAAKTGDYRRRILAAGEMLELGPDSPNLHREAGRYAASQKARLYRSGAGQCRGDREWGGAGGHACVASAFLRGLIGSRGVCCRLDTAGRSSSGERVARSEDGAHRRGATREISPCG